MNNTENIKMAISDVITLIDRKSVHNLIDNLDDATLQQVLQEIYEHLCCIDKGRNNA